jgi:hypothetical protein
MDNFFGLKEIGLKTGNGGNDSCMKPFIMSSLGRMAGVMLSRPAMTTLFVNNIFMGLYFFDEAVDDDAFLEAVFGTSNGPIVKLTFAAFLRFHGWNASFYETQGEPIFAGGVLNYIETSDWDTYMQFVYNVSLPTMVPSELVDVDALLRMVALEAFALDDDHFLAGNNYFLYRPRPSAPWVIIDHDFDTEFAPKHGVAVPSDPLTYPLDASLNGNNALVLATFLRPSYFQRYSDVVETLAASPMLSSSLRGGATTSFNATVESLPATYRRLSAFLYRWVEADVFQQFAFSTTPQSFNTSAWTTSVFLTTRADVVVETLLAARNKPSSVPLSNAEIGGIAAGAALAAAVLGVVIYRRYHHARRHTLGYEVISEKQSHYLV